MDDDRKKPLWPWIAALLIGLPVLYVASFGPACWLTSALDRHGWVEPNRKLVAYWPLGRILHDTSLARFETPRSMVAGPVAVLLGWWVKVGLREGHSAIIPTAPRGSASVVIGY
jgi:hypothetical protein